MRACPHEACKHVAAVILSILHANWLISVKEQLANKAAL